MDYLELKKELEQRRKGTIISLCYKSEPSLNATAKKLGIKLEKITQTTARFGVKYGNIKAVKEQREQDKANGIERQAKAVWWTWESENTIKKNINNDNRYLTLTTRKQARAKVKYLLNGQEISKKELREKNLVVESYWNKSTDLQQYDVNINNIISIKAKG